MNHKQVGVIALVLLCLNVSIGVAPPLPYSISGHILDSNGNAIVGATITLTNLRTGNSLVTYSAINGEYQQDAYNFGPYQDGDIIKYHVVYGGTEKTVTAPIDISKGGTRLDIYLDFLIPEFPTIALPLIIALLGFMFIISRRNKERGRNN